jgi:hypothetical protein
MLSIAIWDGERWRDVRVPPNEVAVDIAIGSALGPDRSVLVRIIAGSELILGVPTADVW